MPDAAADLRQSTAACRLSFTWWGATKALHVQQKATIAESFNADVKAMTAGKKLFDTKDPAYRALAKVKADITEYWYAHTLPYVEPGIRLIRRGQVPEFDAKMVEFRSAFAEGIDGIADAYDELKRAAELRLGDLFNAGDYPDDIRAKFGFMWDYPNTEPPEYLMRLNPTVFRAEQERVRARFEEAVRLTEQAFAEQLQELVTHLADRLRPGEDGSRKVFRDSAVENFREFFDRFRRLNVNSSPELEAVVQQAEGLIQSTSPEHLRGNAQARQSVEHGMRAVAERLDGMIVNPRRRAWASAQPSAQSAPAEENAPR